MEELNKNYNIKNIEIKRDNIKKVKILSIIDSKETLEINLNNSNIPINTNSIKKIYSLSNLKIEENIFYIYKNNAYYQNEPSNNQNLNEIGTSYGKGNLQQSKE